MPGCAYYCWATLATPKLYCFLISAKYEGEKIIKKKVISHFYLNLVNIYQKQCNLRLIIHSN